MIALLIFFSIFSLFNADFTKTLLQNNEAAWQTLTDNNVPLETQTQPISELIQKLEKTVPQQFQNENKIAFQQDVVQVGGLYEISGSVVSFQPFADTKNVFRCELTTSGGTLVHVLTSFIPSGWKEKKQRNEPLNERSKTLGICIRANPEPVFVSSAMRWFPNTFLGNVGFDVGLFDKVPVHRIAEIDKLDDETKKNTFKLTETDNEPFYSLLSVLSKTLPNALEREGRDNKIPVTDLFNDPQGTRGVPVLLFGTAKQIIVTPVDEDTAKQFGIEQYYQIYLFADGAQGNPVVVCVSSLPEGMPTGKAADFSVNLAVAAVPYKLWIYDTKDKPNYAPLLIGRCPVWNPETQAAQPPKSREGFATISVSIFFALLLIWYFLKMRSNRRLKP
jgi:hypothetical protein